MLVADADNDPAFATHRADVVHIRLAAMQTMFQRAAGRAEFGDGVDHEVALDLALGPIRVRTPITRKPIADGYIDQAIDALLNGLLA